MSEFDVGGKSIDPVLKEDLRCKLLPRIAPDCINPCVIFDHLFLLAACGLGKNTEVLNQVSTR